MTYVLALLAAIVGGAVGAFLGFFVAALLAPVLGISSFEGASGYFAVFIGGPIGGLLGLVLGATLVLRKRGISGFGAITGRIGVVLIGVVLVAAGRRGRSLPLPRHRQSERQPTKARLRNTAARGRGAANGQ